jgi:hypothetical protein
MLCPMRRALVRATAVGAMCAVLVSGCGRGARQLRGGTAPVVGVTTPAANTPGTPVAPTGGAPVPQLDDVDGLLNQLDGQLNSDNAAPSDAD